MELLPIDCANENNFERLYFNTLSGGVFLHDVQVWLLSSTRSFKCLLMIDGEFSWIKYEWNINDSKDYISKWLYYLHLFSLNRNTFGSVGHKHQHRQNPSRAYVQHCNKILQRRVDLQLLFNSSFHSNCGRPDNLVPGRQAHRIKGKFKIMSSKSFDQQIVSLNLIKDRIGWISAFK